MGRGQFVSFHSTQRHIVSPYWDKILTLTILLMASLKYSLTQYEGCNAPGTKNTSIIKWCSLPSSLDVLVSIILSHPWCWWNFCWDVILPQSLSNLQARWIPIQAPSSPPKTSPSLLSRPIKRARLASPSCSKLIGARFKQTNKKVICLFWQSDVARWWRFCWSAWRRSRPTHWPWLRWLEQGWRSGQGIASS